MAESPGPDLRDFRDLPTILEFLQRVADVNFPGHRGGRLVVETGYGDAVLPIRPWAPPPPDLNRPRRP